MSWASLSFYAANRMEIKLEASHDPPIPMQRTFVSFLPVAPTQDPFLTFSVKLAICQTFGEFAGFSNN